VPSSWAERAAGAGYFFATVRDGHSIAVGEASVPASREVLWAAHREALVEFARDRKSPQFVSDPSIARAVALLAGAKLDHDVLDPFCGTGSFLWAAIERAQELQLSLDSVLGIEVEDEMFDLARSIAEVAPVPTDIVHGDAFEASRRTQLDAPLHDNESTVPPLVLPVSTVVVAAPPLGTRLLEPQELLDGSHSNDQELVAIDLALRVLAHRGRAVLHVSNSFTFNTRAERYRRYLAENYRIAAVIGLPAGAVAGTQVRSVLLVIDKADPGATFIAQLGEDWRSQLALGGAAMSEALRHVDGRPGSAQ
jgi:type I restriction-modification system DNA methylase subunit